MSHALSCLQSYCGKVDWLISGQHETADNGGGGTYDLFTILKLTLLIILIILLVYLKAKQEIILIIDL